MSAMERAVVYEVDKVTCSKAGMLAAYGLSDRALMDALLLSVEQVTFMKTTEEFQKAHSEGVASRAQRAIDLEEGWDALEEKALESVLTTIQHNRDPRFALQAAMVANRAQRKAPIRNDRVIDASRAGNVIILNLGQKFVQNKITVNGDAVLEMQEEKPQSSLVQRSHDIPTPKHVTSLLGISDKSSKSAKEEYLELCAANGISVDIMKED